jgi:hypothetical protein
LTYLWSVAGGPLLFLLIPGIVLQEITKILETPIRHGIVNRIQYENNRIEDDLNLSGFRRKVYESYENNQRSWNRGLNALVLIGFVLILLCGFALLGVLGVLLFFIMEMGTYWTRYRTPNIEDRVRISFDLANS